ncbi:hypothetical protein I317_06596 [Kwoniella heveanensis CBS 569]|nr:hypothetical protein I317_06596 [Kwoniella heveanensis CBS 569]
MSSNDQPSTVPAVSSLGGEDTTVAATDQPYKFDIQPDPSAASDLNTPVGVAIESHRFDIRSNSTAGDQITTVSVPGRSGTTETAVSDQGTAVTRATARAPADAGSAGEGSSEDQGTVTEPWTSNLPSGVADQIRHSIKAEKWYRHNLHTKNWIVTLARTPSHDLDEDGKRITMTVTKKETIKLLLSCRDKTCSHHESKYQDQTYLDDLLRYTHKPVYDQIEKNSKAYGQYYCDEHLAQRRADQTGTKSLPEVRFKEVRPCDAEYTVCKSSQFEAEATVYGDLIGADRPSKRQKTLQTYRCNAKAVIWQEKRPDGTWADRTPYSYLNEAGEESAHCSAAHWIAHRWQEPHA